MENALNLIYCKKIIAQIISIEDSNNIIKDALEVFISVYCLLFTVLSFILLRIITFHETCPTCTIHVNTEVF